MNHRKNLRTLLPISKCSFLYIENKLKNACIKGTISFNAFTLVHCIGPAKMSKEQRVVSKRGLTIVVMWWLLNEIWTNIIFEVKTLPGVKVLIIVPNSHPKKKCTTVTSIWTEESAILLESLREKQLLSVNKVRRLKWDQLSITLSFYCKIIEKINPSPRFRNESKAIKIFFTTPLFPL